MHCGFNEFCIKKINYLENAPLFILGLCRAKACVKVPAAIKEFSTMLWSSDFDQFAALQ